MKKILCLVDDLKYIKNNCYQSGLYNELIADYDVTFFELNSKFNLKLKKFIIAPSNFNKVISLLRLRSFVHHLPFITEWLKGKELTVYDQDPWASYIDNSPCKNIYIAMKNSLNLKHVFVSTPYWAKKLANDGINASFIHMGIQTNFCEEGPVMMNRDIDLGYIGSLHPYRKKSFEIFKMLGVNVNFTNEKLSHNKYLQYLHNLKIYIFDESLGEWICDQKIEKPSLIGWIKPVEIASRGTFCIRDFHDEGNAYNISNIPLIKCFNDHNDVPDIIENILTMPAKASLEAQKQSVNFIKNYRSCSKAVAQLCQ